MKGNFVYDSRYKKEVNAMLVTGRGGPWDCETSRLPHFVCTIG
jgi:hypothetical protein